MTLKQIIIYSVVILHVSAVFPSQIIRDLNNKLDTVDPEFYDLYRTVEKNLQNMSVSQINGFVCVTGKMHLFGMETPDNPNPDYLKAYFYIKMAAESFEQPECKYYLGIMYNFKLSPHFTINSNIAAKKNKTANDFYLQQLTGSMHLTHSELHLYLASTMGHAGSMMILANQNRMGISTKKNCTAAALYYLEVAKQVYVDDFLKHSFYRDRHNFEEQLYLKEKINTKTLIEDETYIVEETTNIGLESYMANFQIAQNYYYGKSGFRRNFTKAAQMFEKLQAVNNQESAALLGVCYFKGLGVTRDYEKAYELFTDSRKIDLSGFMLAMMEYYGIVVEQNQQNAIRKLIKLSEHSPQSKAFLGSLMIKGLVKNQGFKEGITLLEEASSLGNQHAKFILGMIYLDGASFTYSCEKGVTYLMDSLIISDNCWDKIEQAKYALHQNKVGFALFRYLELSVIGDPVGMINGLYVLSLFEESVNINTQTWDTRRIASDQLYKKLRAINYPVPQDYEELILGDYTRFSSMKQLRELVKIPASGREDYKQYLKNKLLFICQDIGESICKFISYKLKPDIALLKQLVNYSVGKLHVLEARYLLGKKHQEANKTEAAKTMYRFATGSWLMSQVIWHLEGGQLDLSIVDDFFAYASILIVMVGVAFVHRNTMLIKIHNRKVQEKKEADQKKMEEETEGGLPQQTIDELLTPEKKKQEASVVQSKPEDREQESGSSWLKEKDE